MKDKDHSNSRAQAGKNPEQSSDSPWHRLGDTDHFLQLMFFQPSREIGDLHEPQRPRQAARPYIPLRQSKATAAGYCLPDRSIVAPVGLDSLAIDVMTDLRRIAAVTVGRAATVTEANQLMVTRGVRALFVVDDTQWVLGIVTSTDILGEKPIQLMQQRGLRRDEVLVGDIMTPADRLEVIELDDVRHARVGDVVVTLRLSGRQHALVVDTLELATGGEQTVCGIFSLTQIARQLGVAAQPLHDIARTFAEIEAAIGP